jgi:type I restriction enzyme S subunit
VQHQNLISNLSIFCNFPNGFQSLRDFILTQAISGTFSEIKPESWRQTTLGKEVEIIRGITFPSSAKFREPANGRIVCLRTTNIQEQVDWEDLLYVPESYVSNSGQYIRKNDILISMANSRELVGKVSLVTRDDVRCTLGGFISAIRCSETILPEFLMIILRAPATREKIIDSSTQTTNIANISLGRLRPLEISLPSISEQLNIIQKVTQLLKQCDEIETTFSRHKEIGTAARRSAIDAISTAQSPEELQIAWKRIENNWDILTDSRENISDLRTLILKLAMRGTIGEIWDASISAAQELSSVTKPEVREVFVKNCSESDLYPRNWAIATFPNIGQWVSGCGFPTSEQGHKDREILFVKVSDMNLPSNSKYLVEANNSVDSHTALKLRATVLDKGTVVFPKIGGAIATNKRRLITKPTIVDNNCMGIAPCSVIDSEWLFLLLSSIDLAQYQSGTSIPSLSQRILDQIHFGVPPLVEQRIIVQRVNQLMKLCDDLEKSILERSQVAEKFVRSVVSISA